MLAELAQVRLIATDLNDQPVNALMVGQEYYLHALVKDLRVSNPQGVFSAYFDLAVNNNDLLTVIDQPNSVDSVLFSNFFLDGRTATNSIETAAKEIGEVGAFTQTRYYGSETSLFKVRFRADSQGTLQFSTNPAEDFGKVVALWGVGTVENSDVLYGSLSINIVSSVNLTNDSRTVAEDAAPTTFNVLDNDPGGAAAWTIQSINSVSSGGTVTVASDGKSIIYRPAPDFYGTETFKYRAVNSSGVVGEATVTVTVTPVNDAPRNQFPPPNKRVVNEDETLVFSREAGNHIGIWDDQVAPAHNRVNLFALDGGTIFLPNLQTLISQNKIVLEGGANGSPSMQIRGLTDDLNAALDGLQFTPKPNFYTVSPNQVARIRIWTREVSSPAPLLEADNIFEITVNPVNDAPVNIVPGPQTADSSTRVITFDSANRISTSDVDVGNNPMRVSLSVNGGVLQIATPSGISFVSGANNTASMTIQGTLTAINNALLNLRYTGNVGTTNDVLTITTSDLGATGAGGPKSDTDTIQITIAAANQPPVNNVPGPQTYSGIDRKVVFDSTKRISTNDPDAGNANLRVTLFVNGGVLKLGSTSGLTFLNGTTDNSRYMLFDGTQAAINNALLNLTYTANVGTTSDVLTFDVYDLGNTGAGGPKADRDTVNLSMLPNQRPVNAVPGPQTIPSNGVIVFDSSKRISTNDPDVGNGNLRVTLFVNNGVLKLGSTEGLTFKNNTTDNSRYMLFDGTQSAINNALLNLRYTANAGATSDVLTFDVYDLGNTGSGGPQSDRDTINLSTSSTANQAPVNTVPGAQTIPADRKIVFDASKRISTNDPDVGNGNLRVTLFVNNGVLKLGSTSGLTFLNGTTDNSRYMLFDGTQSAINNALLNLTYTANVGTTSDLLTFDVHDLGNTGTGGAKTDRDTVALSTNSNVNQAPVNTVPGAQTIPADRKIVFDSSKRISTNDPDVGNGNLRVTLFVNNGVLKLGSTSGLTFLNGTTDNSRYMLFDGTQSAINNALLNLTYTANVGTTSDLLTFDVHDLGNTGSGGAKTDRDTVAINSGSINKPPVNTVPGAQTIPSNGKIVFDSTKRISTTDPDAGNANLRVTLFVNNGVLKLSTTSGLTFLNGTANNSRYMLFDGNLTAINNALLNLEYTANAGVTSDVLTFDVHDLGNTGAGGAQTDRDTVALTTGNVNKAPVNTVPGPQTFAAANRTVVFDSSKRISTNDPDVGNGNLRVTLFVNNGVLKLSTTSGLTFLNGTSDNSRYMLFDGKQAAVNAALLNLRYTANAGVTSDVLTLDVHDLGNTGAGGAKTDRDTVNLSQVGTTGRSGGVGNGEFGSRNGSVASSQPSQPQDNSQAADEVFANAAQSPLSVPVVADSALRLIDLLASTSLARSRSTSAVDSIFEEV